MSTALITRSKSWTCSLCGCTNEDFLPYERQEEPVASTSKQMPVQEMDPMVPLAKEELPAQQESPVSAETVEPTEASQNESPVPPAPTSDHVPANQSSSIPDQTDQMMPDPNPATTDPVPRETSTLRTFPTDTGAAPAPSTGHIHFSVAGAFQAKVQFYERVLMVVDAFSGAICALLVLWVLKHL